MAFTANAELFVFSVVTYKPKRDRLMDRKEFDSLLQRYTSDQCTDEERSYVESWFDATQKPGSAPDLFQQQRLRDKLWNSIEKQSDIRNSRFDFWKLSKVAAVLLVAGSALFSYSYYVRTSADQSNSALSSEMAIITISNSETSIRKISLLDGSKVLLHPGSELKYAQAFTSNREVYLTGEAFFEVKRDPAHPFLVHTGEVTTRVLGTSFLIQAYQEQKEIKVAVTSGRVSVFSKSLESFFKLWKNKEEHILTPNQQLVYNKDQKTSTKQLVSRPRMIIPDASKELVFTNEPVTRLFKALEKIYGVTIQHEEKVLANCTITTEMTDEGLFERMDVICHVLNASYSVSGTTIIVKSTGCVN